MTQPFSFTLHAVDGTARTGTIRTAHGEVATPAFMAVGTAGTVKAMQMRDVRATGTDVVLGNTYHLMLRPGAEQVAKLGGLHAFSGWPHTMLTDSGGFQVMSLSKLRKVTEQGVAFQSHIDGSKHMLTPERSMEIQGLLGSDIQMQFDECVSLPNSRDEIDRAMRLSLRWAERSKTAFRGGEGQAVFAIVQGGDQPDLRRESATALVGLDFPGYAVGGLAVGEPQHVMLRILEETLPVLPTDRPRYLMGVGTPDDILHSIARGIDMFDCVMPTRAGRHGQAYTRFGRLNLKNARHADDPRPLDPESDCPAARDHSRAYLHHLVRSGEILGMTLLTWANLAYYQQLVAGARTAIGEGRFEVYCEETRAGWERGDIVKS
ncbi:tRNA guanosine(34) transglycosylase Tgt [Terrihabitans sp. B22-R8]|uniref:tRNA guanosine(34) transglycosylase Tgt n=1 Tax=Terrihabitans sp. B22-R8 TaxID=3425128 RepID=UPI00403C7C33